MSAANEHPVCFRLSQRRTLSSADTLVDARCRDAQAKAFIALFVDNANATWPRSQLRDLLRVRFEVFEADGIRSLRLAAHSRLVL